MKTLGVTGVGMVVELYVGGVAESMPLWFQGEDCELHSVMLLRLPPLLLGDVWWGSKPRRTRVAFCAARFRALTASRSGLKLPVGSQQIM